jgi:hypothetical protein
MVSVLWGASLPCGGYKKLGNLRGGGVAPPEGGAAPPGGGGHLGHVFRGQVPHREHMFAFHRTSGDLLLL